MSNNSHNLNQPSRLISQSLQPHPLVDLLANSPNIGNIQRNNNNLVPVQRSIGGNHSRSLPSSPYNRHLTSRSIVSSAQPNFPYSVQIVSRDSNSQTLLSCSKCNRAFKRLSDMSSHLMFGHTNEANHTPAHPIMRNIHPVSNVGRMIRKGEKLVAIPENTHGGNIITHRPFIELYCPRCTTNDVVPLTELHRMSNPRLCPYCCEPMPKTNNL